jgi:hypothetical protein
MKKYIFKTYKDFDKALSREERRHSKETGKIQDARTLMQAKCPHKKIHTSFRKSIMTGEIIEITINNDSTMEYTCVEHT